MISLERRLLVGILLALSTVFGFLYWGAVGAVRSLSESYVAARLEHDAEALLSALLVGQGRPPHLRVGRLTPIYQQPLSGHYFQLVFADGTTLRSRSLWDEQLPVVELPPGVVVSARVAGPATQSLLMRTAGYAKEDVAFSLAVAEDFGPLDAEIRRLQRYALLGLVLALAATVAALRYVLRRGFRSLDQVRTELHEIAIGRRQHLETLGPVEVRPLTDELNRLLIRLQQRLQRSRQGLGNLAHALKTPLSLLTRALDQAALPGAERRDMAAQLERIRVLIERELKRARFAGDGGVQSFNPRQHLPDLIEALQQLYRDRGLRIDVGVLPDVTMPFDREDMFELFGNLLDNACKWASRQVRVQVSVDDGMHLQVADDGPGVGDTEHAALLSRGGRLDESGTGHGLGLSIVNDLVRDYHGELVFTRAQELGGLAVLVSLPLPTGAAA